MLVVKYIILGLQLVTKAAYLWNHLLASRISQPENGFGSPERHIYRVTVWLKSSTANRGKRMLALLRWSTIMTTKANRRREAGVKQSMEIRVRSCMYVGRWVCGYVCMVFGIISRTKARSATNEIPKCSSPERALLRHHIIGVRLLTSARRAKLPK